MADAFELDRAKVYRVGDDFPITLILPVVASFIPETSSFKQLRRSLQADIFETGEVEVVYVNEVDYPHPVATQPDREQVQTLAELSLQDLGVMHPGVADLLNFAQDFEMIP